MFTPIGKVGNEYQMRDDATGQIWPVSEQLANEMMARGAVRPGTMANNMGGGGGGNVTLGFGAQDYGEIPGNAPAAPQTPFQFNPQQALAANTAATGNIADQRRTATPRGPAAPPPNLTQVPPSQPKQQQRPPQGYSGPALVETVRTPGTKAHWAPQSQSRTGIDQGMQDNLVELELDNRRKAMEANNAMYETTLQRANAESLNAQRDRMMAEQELRRKREEDAERNTYAQGVTRRLQQEVEDVRTQKVSTWQQDAGMGGTILAAISMAMGAYAQGINGGPNTAADLINRAIERDTQKKLAEKADRLDSAQQKLRNSMAEFGFSSEQRKQYMTALGQQQAAAYLKQQAADKELAFAHPTMLQNAAALEAQSNQTLTELAKTAQYNATERWVPASGGGFITRLTPEGQAAKLNAEIRGDIAETQGKEAEAAEKMASGSEGTVRKGDIMSNGRKLGRIEDDVVAREINTEIRKFDDILDNGTRLLQLYKNGSSLSSAQKSEAKARRNALVKELKSTGENSDVDAARLLESIGDGFDTWTNANSRALETTLSLKRSARDGFIRQYGLQEPIAKAGKPLRSAGEGF